MLKRVTGVMALAAVALMVTAGNAFAQSTYPVSPKPSTSVQGAGGGNGGTAFTGGSAQVSFGTLMVVVLVVAGIGALLVARRRAARLAG